MCDGDEGPDERLGNLADRDQLPPFRGELRKRCSIVRQKLGHAEIKIGDSKIMLADEFPEMDARGPQTIGGTPVSLMLYFEDCDAVTARAVASGAKVLRPVQDQFYGDRSGTVLDPFGHKWTIATHKEDLSAEELQKRAAALFGQK